MLNGILVIKKEQGFTSNDVVVCLRGICRQKKIGHTGTLDPNAEGVLPVCLGNATKLCDLLTDHKKEYTAELILGKTTDTQDIWGQTLSDSGDTWKELSEGEIEAAVLSFRGKQLQMPPMYSAVKVNGKRLYELARAGLEVERKAREIEVEKIELLPAEGTGQTSVFSALPKLRLRVVCSKGTYIRTICHDIGEKLGCGAVMCGLVRTRSGGFTLEEAHTLKEIEKLRDAGKLEEILIPVDAFFSGYRAVRVSGSAQKYLENGNELSFSVLAEKAGVISEGELLRVYSAEGIFYGVYQAEEMRRRLKPWKVFLLGNS